MQSNETHDWLNRRAELEDNCVVSVGGLISDIEKNVTKIHEGKTLTRSAFARLLELSRREQGLSTEQFSRKLDVDLEEIVGIETDEHYKPSLRTVTKIAQSMKISQEKLFVLAGLVNVRDKKLEEATIKFAARSRPIEELSTSEHKALQEYVRFLCER